MKLKLAALLFAMAAVVLVATPVYAADTAVDTDLEAAMDTRGTSPNHNLVWISPSVGYYFFRASDDFFTYRKTTDSGVTWAAQVEVDGQITQMFDIWYDRWTNGDSGTLIHMVWGNRTGTDTTLYRALDTSNDTFTAARFIVENQGQENANSWNVHILALTKTRGGMLAFQGWARSTAGNSFFWTCPSSCDSGSWTERTDGADGTQVDRVILTPGNETDTDDLYMFYLDIDATELSVKTFDDTGNSWSETVLDTEVDTNEPGYSGDMVQFDAVTRFSDNHTLVAYWNDVDETTADLFTIDLTNGTTFATTTPVVSNLDEAGYIAMTVINQTSGSNADDVYVAFAKGSGNLHSTTDIVFYKSTDGMDTWGTEQAYSEVTDDYRNIAGGHSIGDAGGRYAPIFFDDDQVDAYINLANDVEIPAIVAGGARRIIRIGKLLDQGIKNDAWIDRALEEARRSLDSHVTGRVT